VISFDIKNEEMIMKNEGAVTATAAFNKNNSFTHHAPVIIISSIARFAFSFVEN